MRYAGRLDDRLFQKLMGHIGRPDPRGFVLVLSAARREASPNQF